MEWSAMLFCKSTKTILKPVFDCPSNDAGLAPLWIVGTRDAYVYMLQGDSVFSLLQVEYIHSKGPPTAEYVHTRKRGCSFACMSYFAIKEDGTPWTCFGSFSKTRPTFSHGTHLLFINKTPQF
jgi:hypothetical protein